MVTITCDGCGAELERGALRYTVKVEVKAAYDELEVGLADLVRDHRAEMLALIERMKEKSPKEIEETVYKGFRFDLCPSCQRAYLKNPLRFHPEQGEPPEIDLEAFLRSLGKPRSTGGEDPAQDD